MAASNDSKDMQYALIHKSGCNKPAFYYDHMPKDGDRLEAKHATPEAKERATVMCMACKQPVTARDIRQANIVVS